jgi:hypothetical protein
MKTSVRITLAKLAKVKGQSYQNHSAQQKKEVVTTGAGTTGYAKQTGPANLCQLKKVKKSIASAWFSA